jgi:hypothetical protein
LQLLIRLSTPERVSAISALTRFAHLPSEGGADSDSSLTFDSSCRPYRSENVEVETGSADRSVD